MSVTIKARPASNRATTGRKRRKGVPETTDVHVRALKEFVASQSMDDPFDLYYAGGQTGVPGTKWVVRQPPYSFNTLMRVPYENSILLSCIRAIVTNCDGHGYTMEYIGPSGQHSCPAAVKEKAVLQDLLDHPTYDMTFQTLRERIREDYWTVGNAFIEIGRGKDGRIVSVNHIPAYMMRVTGPDKEHTTFTYPMPRDGNPKATARLSRRFHRFVQMYGIERVFFKEFNDPRKINPQNGMPNDGLAPEDCATEIIHLKFYTPFSMYGVPPWVANMPSVLGTRQAELVNLDFFQENAIPAMALLVSGGQLTDETVQEIEEHFSVVRGRGAMNRVLVLEALGDMTGASETGTVPTPKVELKMLQGERQQDAMFQEFDKNGRMRIRSSFRLPPVLLGEANDYTYATAKVSFEIAESQVFAPERTKMDDVWNNQILTTYQPQFWRFRSNPPRMVDPDDVVNAINVFDKVGALTPNTAIRLYNESFDMHIDTIDQPWGDVPMQLLVEFATNGTLIGFDDVNDPELAQPDAGGGTPADAKQQPRPSSPKEDTTLDALHAMRRTIREFRAIASKMDRQGRDAKGHDSGNRPPQS